MVDGNTDVEVPMDSAGAGCRGYFKQKFYLVNLHFNNFVCSWRSSPLPAWAFEVLWVNKRLGVLDESAPRPAPMSALNAPDNPEVPDCQLSPGGR